MGGAIYNGGNLYIENTAFYKNYASSIEAYSGAIENAGQFDNCFINI